MQHDLEDNRNRQRVDAATNRGKVSQFIWLQPILSQMRQDTAGTESEERNRDCQESEVIEQDDREQARKTQFQQQGGKTAQGNSRGEHSAAAWHSDSAFYVDFHGCLH